MIIYLNWVKDYLYRTFIILPLFLSIRIDPLRFLFAVVSFFVILLALSKLLIVDTFDLFAPKLGDKLLLRFGFVSIFKDVSDYALFSILISLLSKF